MGVRSKVITVAIGLTIAVAPAVPASALFHKAVGERLEELRGSTPAGSQQGQANAQAEREAAKERLTEKREAVIRGFFLRMASRFEAALDRLKDLSRRIELRISRSRVDDPHVPLARAALNRADTKWQEARAALEELKVKLDRSRSAENPLPPLKEARVMAAGVKSKVKAAHAAFVEAVTALKGLGRGQPGPAAPSAP